MTTIPNLKMNINKKSRTLLASALCAYIAASSGLTLAGETRMSTRTTVGELNWTKLPNGRLVSPVHGDMKTGKHITFIKFASGMKTAPHTHSNDYVGIVVMGTARHYQPGFPETETVLPAGSHWAIPGDVVHISECLPASECVFAIYQEAAFDIKPVK
jgi:quercetin dioxygenase-like cupin family protein